MENYTEKQTIRTNILSIVPLRGKVAFPNTLTSFEVGRDITLKAIDRATASADPIIHYITVIHYIQIFTQLVCSDRSIINQHCIPRFTVW